MFRLAIGLLVFFFSFFPVFSQADTTSQSTSKDTTQPLQFLPFLGTTLPICNTIAVKKHSFVESGYSDFPDALKTKTIHFAMNFGNCGFSTPFGIYGDNGFPAVLRNGVPLFIRTQSLPNFEQIPLLYFETIEIHTGLESFLLANNSNGLTLNFVPRVFDTQYPYTQIWIGQSGYEYLGSSGIFSQNISKNLNFAFTYQRYWSRGRYENSQSDKWNLLSALRWKINPWSNLLFEVSYFELNNGLWNGINPQKSLDIFDNTLAQINSDKNKIQTKQFDFNLVFASILNQDSSILLNSSLTLSTSKATFMTDSFFVRTNEIIYGSFDESTDYLTFQNYLNFQNQNFKSTAGMGFEFIPEKTKRLSILKHSTNFNIFSINTIHFSHFFEMNFGARIYYENKHLNFALGDKLIFNLFSNFKLFGEIIFFRRFYQLNFNSESTTNKTNIVQLGFNYSLPLLELNFVAYRKQEDSKFNFIPITDSDGNITKWNAEIIESENTFGTRLNATWHPFKNIDSETNIYLNFNGLQVSFPKSTNLIIHQNVGYNLQVGRSKLKIGLELEVLSPFMPSIFDQRWNIFFSGNSEAKWQWNGLNIYANAKLGNAYVSLSVNNLLSSNYYYFYLYPEYDRYFKISLFWSFLD